MSLVNSNIELLIAIFSAAIAVLAAFYARQAVHAAEKTYNVELIGQLYTIYQSEKMLKNLRISWNIYRELWAKMGAGTEEEKINNANNGKRLSNKISIDYFNKLDPDSDEFKAIHYTINYWTYVELLLSKKAVTTQEVRSFTSPNLLGFLVSMSVAHSERYPGSSEARETPVLENAYSLLVLDRQ